jgi:uncharacterized protein YjbI with pentapeptide repeats
VTPRDLADLPYAAALTGHSGGLAPGEDYDTVHFDRTGFDDADASGSRFLECAFTTVSWQGGRYRRARFNDVWLKDTRFTLSDLAESQWTDATFAGGVVAGVQAFGTRLNRVTFTACKLDSVNFRESELTEVTFRDCLLRDVDFASARLTRCSFGGSRLTGVDLTRVTLTEVDLRDADLGLIIGPDSLRGAIISTGQLALIAPTLADTLGITVADG